MEETKLTFIAPGGSSAVFRGMWKGKPVAIKKFDPDTAKQRIKNSKKFQTEQEVFAALGEHPNIIRLLACVTNPPCLVLELGERELRARLLFDKEKLGPVSVELRMQYAVQIANGLVFMHGKRILHLDLNLENVVIVNGGTQIKIIDFGNAKQLSLNQESFECDYTFGTPGYMAPESNDGKYGYKSDVWSFGVALYGLVTYIDPRKKGPTKENPKWDFSTPTEFPHCTETQVAFFHSFWKQEPKERPGMDEALITDMKRQFNIPEIKEPVQGSSEKTSESRKGCLIC